MTETEKRLEDTLLNAIEKWAEYGCATAEGMQALAAAAQVVVNLERGQFSDLDKAKTRL